MHPKILKTWHQSHTSTFHKEDLGAGTTGHAAALEVGDEERDEDDGPTARLEPAREPHPLAAVDEV